MIHYSGINKCKMEALTVTVVHLSFSQLFKIAPLFSIWLFVIFSLWGSTNQSERHCEDVVHSIVCVGMGVSRAVDKQCYCTTILIIWLIREKIIRVTSYFDCISAECAFACVCVCVRVCVCVCVYVHVCVRVHKHPPTQGCQNHPTMCRKF